MKYLLTALIISLSALAACSGESTATNSTGCIQNGDDTTTTCDGQEFKLYY